VRAAACQRSVELVRDRRTYEVLAVNEAIGISNELLFSLILLVAFLDCTLQDPGQGLGNHTVSIINDRVSPATGLVSLGNAAAVTTSAVTDGIGGDRRRGHDFMVKREGLKRLENCSCHVER
jgi:hypothetical protein